MVYHHQCGRRLQLCPASMASLCRRIVSSIRDMTALPVEPIVEEGRISQRMHIFVIRPLGG